MKQTNLSSLNTHLFEAIEMLKNNNDPNADANEKIDILTAKAIAELGTVIVESAKTQVQALSIIAKASNPTLVTENAISSGVLPEDTKQMLPQ